MRSAGVLLVVLVGCASSGTVICGELTCPADTTCRQVQGKNYCATHGQLDACKNAVENGACTTTNIPNGVCHEGVCFSAGCGNSLVEPREQCDDGNQVSGDGCSGDCASDETCGNGVADPLADEQCDDNNLLNGDGCDSRCLPEQAFWRSLELERMLQPIGAPMMYPSIVYDEARRVTLMFGGQDANGALLDDTWLWNGSGWAKAEPQNRPSPRYGSAITYDANRKRVVLFGGETASGVVSETWEWDGSTWTVMSAARQPLACKWGSLAYDPKSKHVLLFGGLNTGGGPGSVVASGLWSWDGTAWTQLIDIKGEGAFQSDRPLPRFRAGMALDAKRGKIVLYGGYGVLDPAAIPVWGYNTDTWEYDSTPPEAQWPDGIWRRISTTAPAVASNDIVDDFAIAWDPSSERVVMLGGKDASLTAYGNAFAWTGAAWTQLADPSPLIARAGHALASDTTRKRVLAWGGESNRKAQELDDLGAWNLVPPSQVATIGEQVALDTNRGRAVMFASDGVTWEFDGYAWQRRSPGVSPVARRGAALTYDPVRKQVVLFGGGDTTTDQQDTWVYAGADWVQKSVATSPPGRRGAAMVYDAKRDRVVMFGGTNAAGTLLGDTWTWDGTSWTDTMTNEVGRAYSGIAYDPDIEKVVRFGGGEIGSNSVTVDGNVSLWDGATWAALPVPSPVGNPVPRLGAAMTWDPGLHRVVMVGGVNGFLNSTGATTYAILQDTWLWDTSGWTLLTVNQLPPNRFGAALFAEPRGRGLTLFGGHTTITEAGDFHDTWQLRWHGATPEEVCREADADFDGDGKKSCDDADCSAVCSGCGDGACNSYLETHELCPQDCATAQSVCGDYHCDPGETCVGDCP